MTVNYILKCFRNIIQPKLLQLGKRYKQNHNENVCICIGKLVKIEFLTHSYYLYNMMPRRYN